MPGRATFVLLAITLLSTNAASQDINTGSHKLIKVGDGIYAVEPVFAGANGALIVNKSGVVVIDSHSTPASSATLIEAVRQITDTPIRFVVNTHWHVDHHSGNETYAETYGPQVNFIAHHHTREDIPTLGREQYEQSAPYRTMPLEKAGEMLETGVNSDGQVLSETQRMEIERFHDAQEAFLERSSDFDFTLPNLTLDNSLTLHGDPNTIEVKYLYPAHTRGDVVAYIPEQKVLIVGDILTKPILWTWSSHPRDYIRTLQELEQLDIDHIVIGHGGPVLEGRAYLTMVREFMQTIVTFSEQSKAAGLSVEAVIERGAQDGAIQGFRRRFVADNEQENSMFDQMVGWTINRAYLEIDQ